jgi:ribosome maturation factor RimP
MSFQEKIEQFISASEQVCSALGFEVVAARMTQAGKRRSLEVTIHKLGDRVTLDDCETVSRKLEALLDEQSPPIFDGAFVLEVQSPGIDRQLKTDRELRIFSGEKVEIKTKEIIPELGDVFTGILKGLQDSKVQIEHPERTVQTKKGKAPLLHKAPPDEIQLDLDKVISIKRFPQPVQHTQTKEQLNIGGPQP